MQFFIERITKVKEHKKNTTYENPILSGFYPDPSICRVEEDYYLVTSTFAYFPAIPIFHSKDLVNWRQIGNVLERKKQVDLSKVEHSQGIFAPTIRYQKGVFYMITTHIPVGENFIVTAEDPAGPWSDAILIHGAEGIDPSLFFDEDNRIYYVGTRPRTGGERYSGDWEIWLQELNPISMQLVGESSILWQGALRGAIWPEGPHLYKKDGEYFLMIAEGGTSYEHAVTIAKSNYIRGPYRGNPCNPILTHRHLGMKYPITNVGHGDLINTQHGEWWMVVLASRPYGGNYRNLGRETFLVPVQWDGEWPIINPGKGVVEKAHTTPRLPVQDKESEIYKDDFNTEKLDYRWIYLRTPKEQFYSLDKHRSYLRLKLQPQTLRELESPSYIGLRQKHMCCQITIKMKFIPHNNEVSGMAILQSNQYHYRLEYAQLDKKRFIQVVKCEKGQETILARGVYDKQDTYLRILIQEQAISFMYGEQLGELKILVNNVDGRILSTDVAGGFVGNTIGMYCSSNGVESNRWAEFDWFEYIPIS